MASKTVIMCDICNVQILRQQEDRTITVIGSLYKVNIDDLDGVGNPLFGDANQQEARHYHLDCLSEHLRPLRRDFMNS